MPPLRYFLSFVSLLVAPFPAIAADAFSDVTAAHENAAAIAFLKERGVVQGYVDGSFKPDRSVTRAEFVKILITLRDPSDNARCDTPPDVRTSDWFYKPVCLAMQERIVKGGADGLFHPSDKVTLADASVMLARAYALDTRETDVWYEGSVRALFSRNAVPDDIEALFMNLSRAQVAEMLWRMQKDVTERVSADADSVLGAVCSDFHAEDIAKVDMQEVQRVWLGWINDARAQEGLPPYRWNRQLARTAWIWSDRARSKGSIDHRRDGQAAYYDYAMTGEWFSSLGLDFRKVNGTTYTENIGWGVFRCSKDDCTGSMIDAVRLTFDFFMSEKGKAYRPHYNSIVNPSFTELGMGLTLSPDGRYYLTTHYGTEIVSDPDPVCS